MAYGFQDPYAIRQKIFRRIKLSWSHHETELSMILNNLLENRFLSLNYKDIIFYRMNGYKTIHDLYLF